MENPNENHNHYISTNTYNLQYFFLLYLFCEKPINLFNPGNNTKREDFADGFSSSKYSIADNGWKSTLQSEANLLTKTHYWSNATSYSLFSLKSL